MPDFLKEIDPTLLAIIAGVLVLFWPQLKELFSRLNIPGFSSRLTENSLNAQRLAAWEELYSLSEGITSQEFRTMLDKMPYYLISKPNSTKVKKTTL